MKQTTVLIIGASISGLACAATLQRKKIDYVLIEKENSVAFPWRNHYDRLHLHTVKSLSQLPYKKMRKSIPAYASRLQVIDYLEGYQEEFNIVPFFHTEAISVKREDNQWITKTSGGIIKSNFLIMATGAYGKAKTLHADGIETFTGKILHSSQYKTGKDFSGQKVLVVGFGNSACEIAIDLFEQNAFPSMSVRSPVNVIPRDILGISTLKISLLMQYLPPRIADKLSAPLINLLIGDIRKSGLKKKSCGPLVEIVKEGKVPVIDIGTMKHIRAGNILIQDAIESIKDNTVYFKGNRNERFDAIIAAIGYEQNFGTISGLESNRFSDLQVSIGNQKYFGKDGLYFCGYWISPAGQIREIGLDARKIATDIIKKIQPGH